MNKEEIYLQIDKHKEDMLKSDVKYWIKRYDIKYQQNKENYDKLKECEQQLQAYKDKEDKLREELLIWGEVINPTLQNKLLQILNEGSDK